MLQKTQKKMQNVMKGDRLAGMTRLLKNIDKPFLDFRQNVANQDVLISPLYMIY